MTKSAMAVPCNQMNQHSTILCMIKYLTGLLDGHVRTVKMDGSQWSKLTLLITQKLAKSY
jgi:hypothetical protein